MPLYIGAVNFTEMTRRIGFLPGLFPDGVVLIDTPFPLIASAFFGVGLRAGLFIFIFRQFYRNLPVELEDAAYVDGCGPMMAYWRVMFVNAGPVLLVAFLFSFVWYWNDTLNVSLFFTSARPLSVVVATFREILNMYRSPEGVANSMTVNAAWTQAACLLYIAPILAVYVFLQKYFTQSIVRSGIVG
jgi:multiple sugar transport system permease protein